MIHLFHDTGFYLLQVLAYPADEQSVDAPSPTGSKKGAEKGAKGDKKPPEKKDDKAKVNVWLFYNVMS